MVLALTSFTKASRSACKLPAFGPVWERLSRAFLPPSNPGYAASLAALEPAITAELLSAANLPAYRKPFQVYTAAEAIEVLGWNETERVLRLAFEAQETSRSEIQALIRSHLAHSLACAVVASELADFLRIPPDRAFAFGLLHDIGAWGLVAESAGAYSRVFSQGSRTPLEKLGAEECLLGIDHCKAGAWLVKSWGLPPEFAEATAMHHETTVEGRRGVALLVALACRWADALGLSAGHSERTSVRDAIGMAPPDMIPKLRTESVEIGRRSRARLVEFARQFDEETARCFLKLQ